MEYKVLKRMSLEQLEMVVVKFMKDGYRPQGGVSFDGQSYIQAMIK